MAAKRTTKHEPQPSDPIMKDGLLPLLAAILISGVMNVSAQARTLDANGFDTDSHTIEVSDSLKQSQKLGEAIFYKFNYPSVNVAGEDVVLSSSLVAWMPTESAETDSIESLHIYSHFTIAADKECPSADTNVKERLLFTMLVRGEYGLGDKTDRPSSGRRRGLRPEALSEACQRQTGT